MRRFVLVSLVVWGLVGLAAAFIAPRLPAVLHAGSAAPPDSESARAAALLDRELEGRDRQQLVLVFTAAQSVDDAAVKAGAIPLVEGARQLPGVARVRSYWDSGDASLKGRDGHSAIAVVEVGLSAGDTQSQLVPALRELAATAPVGLAVHVTGGPAVSHDLFAAAIGAAHRAEWFAIPAVFVLLVLVCGSLVAGLIPLLVGLVSAGVSLAGFSLYARLFPTDSLAPPVISLVGMGLGAIYSLSLVARFREELAAGRKRLEAVRRSMATAGRTVAFAGAAALTGAAGLCLIRNAVFTSLAAALALAVISALLAATMLLRAVLYLLGARIDGLRILRPAPRHEHGHHHRKSGWWYRWAHAVMRRPALFAAVALIPLLLLAAPVTGLLTGRADANLLPDTADSRQGNAVLGAQFGAGLTEPIDVVVQVREGTVTDAANLPRLYALAEALRKDPAVAAVVSHVSLQPGWELAQYQNIYIDKPAQFADLPASLTTRYQDLSQSAAALRQLRDGLAAVAHQIPDLGNGGGASIGEIRSGLAQTQAGLRGTAGQVGAVGDTLMQVSQLVGTVDTNLGQALSDLEAMSPAAKADPHFAAAYQRLWAARQITTGPPPGASAGPSLSMWIGQTGSNVGAMAKALEALAGGLSQTDTALADVAGGLDKDGTSLAQALQGLNSTAAGLDTLIAGLSQTSGAMQQMQWEIDSVNLKAALAQGDFGLRLAMTAGGDSARQLLAQLVNVGRGDNVARLIVMPKAGAAAPETRALIRRLRAETVPAVAAGLGTVLVGGAPAEQLDFDAQISGALPRVIGLVLLIAFVVLAVMLRSLVLPLKAILMSALSVAAAYGTVVLVFRHGGTGYVTAPSVGLLFAILFGMSLNSHVILLSRVKEAYAATGKLEEAVAAGLQQTSGVITGSALSMLLLCGAFVRSGMVPVQELGIGLGMALLLDATLIRLLLAPAGLRLWGEWNWWAPPWLGPTAKPGGKNLRESV